MLLQTTENMKIAVQNYVALTTVYNSMTRSFFGLCSVP